ncbi:MAG: hypothetical protein NTV17_16805, partial [Burkholderiales bacterium]|nr:hypothetical protein [Burkholderiales bacterium]
TDARFHHPLPGFTQRRRGGDGGGLVCGVQLARDADRLDLARAGITPHPKRLCTDPARAPQTIEAAVRMAKGRKRA